jgi:hypothetical protein
MFPFIVLNVIHIIGVWNKEVEHHNEINIFCHVEYFKRSHLKEL